MVHPTWLRLLPVSISSRFSGRQNLLKIVENSGWLLFDKLLRLVAGLLVSAWVARYLGPFQFGQLAYVLAYLALFQAVATLGLDGIVVRRIAVNPEASGAILGSACILRLVAGFTSWIGAIVIMASIDGIASSSVHLTALAGGVLIFQAADTIDLWFQSQSQSRRTVLAKLLAYIISNGIKVFLILNKAPLLAFSMVIFLDALTSAVGLMLAYRKHRAPVQWCYVGHMALSLLRESWPLALSGISVMVYMRIDQVMVKKLIGDRELGVYAAVLPLATLWQFVPATLVASLAPFVARKKQQGETGYWQALNNITGGLALLGWMVSVPMALLAVPLVGLLFGEQYHAGGVVLAIYSFTNIFINIGMAQTLWVLNERRSVVSLYKTLIGAMICITGNLALIPRFGIVGVAFVAVLAQFGSAIASNIFFSRRLLLLQLRRLVVPSFAI